MVPFKTPAWRKKILQKTVKDQDRVIGHAVRQMEAVMKKAVEYVMEHYEKTGRYAEPTLSEMYEVSSTFYYHVVHAAFDSAYAEKVAQKKHEPVKDKRPPESKLTKMSGWPIGIPKSLVGLEKIFRDKRYWPVIMKRSKYITDKVRKKYLGRLRAKFMHILPDLEQNVITPAEAKAKLMETWDASKSRTELIFRTETTTYFGKTQTAFFSGDPEIIGFLFDSVRDTSRTEWCKSRHGLVYKPGSTGVNGLSYNTPAIHWNCRSHLIPLANTPYNRTLVDDPKRDPENRKVAALPPGWRSR